jgi:hypothetical protein
MLFPFRWCDVRTVERWMLKDVEGCRRFGLWTLCGFVCSSFVVVVVGESARALRDRRVCVEVV